MAHPQIAVFARLARENAAPTRLIYGQKTLLSRTMHDIRYDEIHDEIVVANPFAQALLTSGVQAGFVAGSTGRYDLIAFVEIAAHDLYHAGQIQLLVLQNKFRRGAG